MADDVLHSIAKKSARKMLIIEFWVGIFFLVSLACLGYLCVTLGKMRLFDADRYVVKAEFDNISGLKQGAPVELAGVPIGEIVSLDLRGVSAIASLRVRNDVRLRSDDIAAVRTKGIIGDRYIKIIPGASETFLNEGDEITDTESTIELEDLIGKFMHRMD